MFCDWLARRAMHTPDKVALIDTLRGGERVTYGAWHDRVTRTARLLARLGVAKGHRVAIVARNSAAYLDLLFACGKLGAILQTLNWRLTPRELSALLLSSPPEVLVYADATSSLVREVRAGDPVAGTFVALDGAPLAPTDHLLSSRDDEPSTPLAAVDVRAEDPFIICYTGGSTGVPKGAVLTHGSVLANAVNTVASWGLTERDVAILNAPLFHVGGLNVLTTPLVLVGGTSIVCEAFDAGQVFDLVERHGVTAFFGVPTMFLSLLSHPRWEGSDLSRVKLVISGGAPCPEPILQAFWGRGIDMKTGYGLTEAGPNNFWLPPSMVRKKPGCVGHPLFTVETRVVADGRDCAQGETGELWLRGPHLFAGYWGRPDETAKTLEGGWLHTGDLVRVDDDGCFYIVGRLKDLIISGGENVYPAEIEGVIAAHPAVAEVALIGVPDERWGEVGLALVVRRDAQPVTDAEIVAFARERLARFKVPREVRFVDALPRTAAGKIDKPRLRAEHGGAGR